MSCTSPPRSAALPGLLREYRATGRVSDALALELLGIARAAAAKYDLAADPEDFAQDCYLHLSRPKKLGECDPDKAPHSFLFQAAYWFGLSRKRKAARQAEREQQLRESALHVAGRAGRRVVRSVHCHLDDDSDPHILTHESH